MADFSLTTLFVLPNTTPATAVATTGSTQDLTPGQVGVYGTVANVPYTVLTTANIASVPYFYFAQGRANTYLQGSKRSDKIKPCGLTLALNAPAVCNSNVTEFYKVAGCPTATVQITDIDEWNVQCGDIITLTLRAHSSYIDTLYFNGFTRSVTIQAPCCECDGTPCDPIADLSKLINQLILKLREQAPGNNPDNISLNTFYTFENIGGTTLRISGKPLTKYGVPCDVAAFPHEYDRMWFRAFVYEGPATTVDFIVADACNFVATPNVIQRASYATGTPEEIRQLEKNYYSYQAGYLKHLYRMAGYNQNYESYVVDGVTYDTYYIKFNEFDKSAYQWGDYIPEDQMVILAAVQGSAPATALQDILVAAFGTLASTAINACITSTSTTSSTSTASLTTTTTSNIP